MGKDVIIILIIILSYKILMKYSILIEGVDGNNGDDDSIEPNQGILRWVSQNAENMFDGYAQNASDLLFGKFVCPGTSRAYDSLRRQCVDFNPKNRPDKCKPETDINCTYKVYNPEKSCSEYTDEKDCNANIECMYDSETKVCINNTNICSFREDFCNSKNFSHWGSIEPLVQLYIQQSNTLESHDILLSDFITDNQTIPDLNIKDEDITVMIDFYNSSTEQISNVTNLSLIHI